MGLILLAMCGGPANHSSAAELRWDATQLFRHSTPRNVRLNADRTALVLEEGELIEDDGPAAGYSYRPNEEPLAANVSIKKELLLERSAARSATLLVAPGGELRAHLNGTRVDLPAPGRAGNYWQTYPIPPDLLRAGINEVILSGTGRFWIARSEDYAAGSIDRPRPPHRSLKSTDGGQTWVRDQLGPDGKLSGEYYVRLYLDRYRPDGALTLPVLDAANLSSRAIDPPVAQPITVRCQLQADTPAGTSLRVRWRSGPTPVPDSKLWSAWHESTPGEVWSLANGRYLQVSLHFTSSDPRQTPQVREVHFESSVARAEDWSTSLRVNPPVRRPIARTSIPFAYESSDHPRLQELRDRFQLDQLVRGAKTELEQIQRLAIWSAARWQRGHLSQVYPPWDALEILKSHTDGTPVGGFCQQYNLVFLQACESLGIVGRVVSIGPGDHGAKIRGGHEVVELWSNQFQKWIYVDGNMAWYATDPDQPAPLSLWELRQRQLPLLRGQPVAPIRVVHLAPQGKRWESLADWPPFLELRMVPRSNFLAETSPLPLHQGMRGWFWTGNYAWTDDEAPASRLYSLRISDRRNWEWPLHETHVWLEATPTPGELLVHLDSVTPNFESYVAAIDEAPANSVTSGFKWKIHGGVNRLEVRARNRAGVAGPSSVVTVE